MPGGGGSIPSILGSSLGAEAHIAWKASEYHPPLEMLCFLLAAQMEPGLPHRQELVACPCKTTGLVAVCSLEVSKHYSDG